MYRIIRADKDAYVTDRIVDNTFRATDANVGHAASLDLFKLFDESSISGTLQPLEKSRLLVHFDLDAIRAVTGSIVDFSDSSFKATMILRDIVGGQPVPSNYTVIVHPVSKSWDEGIGRDVGRYSDLDAVNWVTASVSTGLDTWNTPGAGGEGLLGSTDIDIITSGNIGAGVEDLFKTQLFEMGEEDLEIDVTNLVSATLAGILPDEGFRIAFSGVLETNSSSLFVKRFGTRHGTNARLAPSLIVKFDDSLQDNHSNFLFDTSGSLFLFNDANGTPVNLLSGSAASELTGLGALSLKLISGGIAPVTSQSFSATYSVDQFSRGDNFVTGVYVANFAVSSFDDALINEITLVGSATFHTIWGSNDGTVAYRTGSIVINRSDLNPFVQQQRQLIATIPNHRQVYRRSQVPRIRINVLDILPETALKFSKLPLERVGEVIDTMYWRLVDIYSSEVVIPFDTTDDSTRMSTDAKGMFFDFFPTDLNIGRVFSFEFLIQDGGEDIIIDKNLPTFRIEP